MLRPFALVGLFLGASAAAQPAEALGPTRGYIELLGNGGLTSLNLERQVAERVAVRVGVGYSLEAVSVPLMLTLTPAGGSGLEVGAGVVVQRRTREASFAPTLGTLTVGYRWVTPEGDLFRVGFTPLHVRSDDPILSYLRGFVPWAGVSFGAAL